jgi:hypothetical protein
MYILSELFKSSDLLHTALKHEEIVNSVLFSFIFLLLSYFINIYFIITTFFYFIYIIFLYNNSLYYMYIRIGKRY